MAVTGIAVLAIVVSIVFVVTRPPAPTPATPELSADQIVMAALTELRSVSQVPVEIHVEHGVPQTVRAKVPVQGADPVGRALDYLSRHRSLYGLDGDVTLRVQRVSGVGEATTIAVSFGQIYRGVPVLGAGVTIPTDETSAYGSGGALRPDLALETTPAVDPEAAVAFALSAVGGIKTIGRPSLVIVDPTLLPGAFDPGLGDEPRLAWRIRSVGDAVEDVFVDASSPALLLRSAVRADDPEINVASLGNETNAFESQFDCAALARRFDPLDPETLLAFKLFDDTADWYSDVLNRDSWNGDGVDIDVHINATMPKGIAAHWFGGCKVFEFKDGSIQSSDGTEHWDIVAHEFQHAVTGTYGDLLGAGMAGAVNEGISDAFAMFVTGKPRSKTESPNANGYPDHVDEMYSVLNPCGPQDKTEPCRDDPFYTDDGWEHWNSTLISVPAYLMLYGGTHPDTGIEVRDAPAEQVYRVWYYALDDLPYNGGSLYMLRWSLENAETSGHSADAICSARNAFAAIGVGPADQDCNGVGDDLEDDDMDGVVVERDNCPTVANPTQIDSDQDEIGDACDPDRDGDGVPQVSASGIVDNCPDDPNAFQGDANFNQVGTICDPTEDGDLDNDGLPDKVDNCPLDFNPRPQPDVDGDGAGDACDPDHDGDGVSTNDDNCPGAMNANQADRDGDGLGDACDTCPLAPDSGIAWASDVIITDAGEVTMVYQLEVADADGDGTPDACDRDFAGDGASLRIESAGGIASPRGALTKADLVLAGEPSGEVSIALPLCDLICIEIPPVNPCVEIRVSGMDSTTGVAVRDSTGDQVARAAGVSDGTLRYSPTGGTSYELVFALLDGASGDDRLSVTTETCTLGDGGQPAPSPGSSPFPTVVPIPSFTSGAAKVEFSIDGKSYSLTGGRCGVAALDGYTFSVSAGDQTGLDFIALSAFGVSIPLAGSWAAVVTGTGAGTTFATLSGAVTIHADGIAGDFSGQTADGKQLTGAFTC